MGTHESVIVMSSPAPGTPCARRVCAYSSGTVNPNCQVRALPQPRAFCGLGAVPRLFAFCHGQGSRERCCTPPKRCASAGTLQGGYTLFVAQRAPFIRVIRDGHVHSRRISLDADAVAITTCGHTLYVALASSLLALYDVASLSRRSGVALPSPPLALATLSHPNASLAAVALRSCTVLLYNGSIPISRHETCARVLGLYGGVRHRAHYGS